MSRENSRYLEAAVGAVAGFTLGSIIVSTYLSNNNNHSHAHNNPPKTNTPKSSVAKEYPDELKEEMFSRVRTFFGDEGIQKLSDSFVVVSCIIYNFIHDNLHHLAYCDIIFICYVTGGWSGWSRQSLCTHVSSLRSRQNSLD